MEYLLVFFALATLYFHHAHRNNNAPLWIVIFGAAGTLFALWVAVFFTPNEIQKIEEGLLTITYVVGGTVLLIGLGYVWITAEATPSIPEHLKSLYERHQSVKRRLDAPDIERIAKEISVGKGPIIEDIVMGCITELSKHKTLPEFLPDMNDSEQSYMELCIKEAERSILRRGEWERLVKGILSPVVSDASDGMFRTPILSLDPSIPSALYRAVTLSKDYFPLVAPVWEIRAGQYYEKYKDKYDPEEFMSYVLPYSFQRLCKLYSAFDLTNRFEHMHILGGTGHGKTQLLQYLMTKETGRFCVIDSQGDMIEKLAKRFDCILIDPTDTEYPVALNLFAFKAKTEQEMNAVTALYQYVFKALLGAELTQRQSLLFGYLARLLMQLEKPTFMDFIDIMGNPDKYTKYIDRLGTTAGKFFREEFCDPKKYRDTRHQILTRLYGVLENQTFERMFAATEQKVNIEEAMNEGKIILINTAKAHLQAERSAIFGRFFIALIMQATIRRAGQSQRTPYFVYIDEAHEYMDENIETMLNTARKYNVGMILAHQNLDQLPDKVRATIMSSTSIKFAGGVSAKDAQALSHEMRCERDTIMNTKKGEWVAFIRGQGVRRIKVPFGDLEAMPERPDYESFLKANREKYARKLIKDYPKREENTQVIHSQVADSDGDIWG